MGLFQARNAGSGITVAHVSQGRSGQHQELLPQLPCEFTGLGRCWALLPRQAVIAGCPMSVGHCSLVSECAVASAMICSAHNPFVFTPVLKAVLQTLLGGRWVPLAQAPFAMCSCSMAAPWFHVAFLGILGSCGRVFTPVSPGRALPVQ